MAEANHPRSWGGPLTLEEIRCRLATKKTAEQVGRRATIGDGAPSRLIYSDNATEDYLIKRYYFGDQEDDEDPYISFLEDMPTATASYITATDTTPCNTTAADAILCDGTAETAKNCSHEEQRLSQKISTRLSKFTPSRYIENETDTVLVDTSLDSISEEKCEAGNTAGPSCSQHDSVIEISSSSDSSFEVLEVKTENCSCVQELRLTLSNCSVTDEVLLVESDSDETSQKSFDIHKPAEDNENLSNTPAQKSSFLPVCKSYTEEKVQESIEPPTEDSQLRPFLSNSMYNITEYEESCDKETDNSKPKNKVDELVEITVSFEEDHVDYDNDESDEDDDIHLHVNHVLKFLEDEDSIEELDYVEKVEVETTHRIEEKPENENDEEINTFATKEADSSVDFDDTLKEMEMALEYGLDYEVDKEFQNCSNIHCNTPADSNSRSSSKCDSSGSNIHNNSPNVSSLSVSSNQHNSPAAARTYLQLPAANEEQLKSRKSKRTQIPVKTPIKAPKSPFKVPAKTVRKATDFKSICSPIGLYIKRSPRAPLKQSIVSHDKKEFKLPRLNPTPPPLKENKENEELPMRIYKPSKHVVASIEAELKLPASIEKLFPTKIKIIKHTAKVGKRPLRESELLEELQKENLTLDDSSFSPETSSVTQDVSFHVSKLPYKISGK